MAKISITRLFLALAVSVAVLFSSNAVFCKAKPAAKPVPKEWVTKSAGRLTFSVPKDWKNARPLEKGMICWYVGASVNSPSGVFGCSWEKARIKDVLNGMNKGAQVRMAGKAATEYTSMEKAEQILVVIANKPEADGKKLVVAVGSATGEFKKYEPILRKILASIVVKK